MPVPFPSAWRARPAAVLLALAASLTAPALAQTPSDTPATRATGRPGPDATDPAAAVPTLTYRSSLQTYRRHVEGPPRAWREANDEVLRIGGWRSYLREAQGAPAASPEPAPGSSTAPVPAPTPVPAAPGSSPNVPGGQR